MSCGRVRDSQGKLLVNHDSVKERWRCYFQDLLSNHHTFSFPSEPLPNPGLVALITPDETQDCLYRINNLKAVGSDEVGP
ncbi:unnamed protein product [Euphydryas editha]|uniref:Uncharacterized protein n=1 Tax=Euphydryas editha TaxID=104508 RepID=A0AAU9UIP2_EUPED|nr:unnamed protein product [Euphydryas editha]